jgi:hypothetical protein
MRRSGRRTFVPALENQIMKVTTRVLLPLVLVNLVLLSGCAAKRTVDVDDEKASPGTVLSASDKNEMAAPSRPATAQDKEAVKGDSAETAAIPGEALPDGKPGSTSIPMLGRPDLELVPADSGKARSEQREWLYLPHWTLTSVRYDADMRELEFCIDPSLGEEATRRVNAHLQGLTGASGGTIFRLNPIRVQSVTVELLADDQSVVLLKVRSGHEFVPAAISHVYKVRDEEIHDLLARKLANLSIIVRSMSPHYVTATSSMSVEAAITNVRATVEKVLPSGMTLEELVKHPLILDRDSAFKLQDALRAEWRGRVEGSQAKLAPFTPLFQRMVDRIVFTELSPLEITPTIIDSVAMWNRDTMKLEVSPGEKSKLTEALTEATEARTSHKKVWDLARTTAKDTGDYKEWHRTLNEKLDVKSKAEVGIKLFSASAEVDVTTARDESNKGAEKKLEKLYNQMKNAGEYSDEEFKKSYRAWKGKEYESSRVAKVMNLRRVTAVNVGFFKRMAIDLVERLKTGMYERATPLKLSASRTQNADVLQQLAEMRHELEKRDKELKKREKELDQRVKDYRQQSKDEIQRLSKSLIAKTRTRIEYDIIEKDVWIGTEDRHDKVARPGMWLVVKSGVPHEDPEVFTVGKTETILKGWTSFVDSLSDVPHLNHVSLPFKGQRVMLHANTQSDKSFCVRVRIQVLVRRVVQSTDE